MATLIVFHGTDASAAAAILRTRKLLGDARDGFGPGVCTSFSRALCFAGRKCGLRVRKIGRILALDVKTELMDGARSDNEEGAFTLDSLRALSLDDSRVLGVKIITPREWDARLARERSRARGKSLMAARAA